MLTKEEIYRERVTVPMSKDQRLKIEKIVLDINDNGRKKHERITANSVIRCLIDSFDFSSLDYSHVYDERSLRKSMGAVKGQSKA